MSPSTREFAKSSAVGLLLSGLGYLIGGPVAGAFLLGGGLFLAVILLFSRKGKKSEPGTVGINWIRSEGRMVRPRVRGYDTGIHVEDSPELLLDDPDIQT